jgi:predicted HicB family RNase H-like nuclease
MSMPKKDFKRLTLDIHKDVHRDIKIAAALKGISMNLWLSNAIYRQLVEEKKTETTGMV